MALAASGNVPVATKRVRARATAASPRIAVVGPSADAVGGQAVQARALVDGLRADGVTVRTISISPSLPTRLRRLPYVRTVLNQALYLPGLLRLASVDVIHIFSASYWSFLISAVPAMLVGRLFGKRVILNYHSGEAPDHLARWGVLVHPWLSLAHVIVVPSEFLRRVFAEHGYDVAVVPNVVDISTFSYRARRVLRPRLLSVRHLEPGYGVGAIIEAFARVRAAVADATLTVAGSGSEEAVLRARVDALGLRDAVRFVGRQDRAGLAKLHTDADIFVNASAIDNQPVSILEAMASGLPIVSTGPGDIPFMLRDGESGVLVAQRDPGAMAHAVLDLVARPAYAVHLAEAAHRDVERFSWECTRTQWAAVYRGHQD